jgi:predicted RecB family nuclease
VKGFRRESNEGSLYSMSNQYYSIGKVEDLMDPFLIYLLLAPLITGVVCLRGSAKAKAASSPKRSKKETSIEEYVPKVEEPTAKLRDLPIETIEGIGSAYGRKLRRAGIITVEDLLAAGTIQVARICDVSEDTAAKWQAMSRFCWLEGISEEDSEAIVQVGIRNYQDLANSDADILLMKVTQAVADGTVEVPEGYEFTVEMVQTWIEAVKTFIADWQKQ